MATAKKPPQPKKGKGENPYFNAPELINGPAFVTAPTLTITVPAANDTLAFGGSPGGSSNISGTAQPSQQGATLVMMVYVIDNGGQFPISNYSDAGGDWSASLPDSECLPENSNHLLTVMVWDSTGQCITLSREFFRST
jgi:hypothetical protein